MTTKTKVPLARDIMTRHVHVVDPAWRLTEVVDFLTKHSISSAPVVEVGEQGKRLLVGFLSEGDCLEHLANEMFFGSPSKPETAASIMQRHPICVDVSADIFSLASVFVSHRLRHLPVIEDDEFVGIVSRKDILRSLTKYRRGEDEAWDLEHHPPDLSKLTNLRFLLRR